MKRHNGEVKSIAFITGYKEQERALRARIENEEGLHSIPNVYYGTVDGYQVMIRTGLLSAIYMGCPGACFLETDSHLSGAYL